MLEGVCRGSWDGADDKELLVGQGFRMMRQVPRAVRPEQHDVACVALPQHRQHGQVLCGQEAHHQQECDLALPELADGLLLSQVKSPAASSQQLGQRQVLQQHRLCTHTGMHASDERARDSFRAWSGEVEVVCL